ncbi:MAG: hypothetical protein IJZ47_12615, partial [Oscillospiraceae bacterium]|nr:hypothetical protein [Oscillospiraceae bacterium]
MTKAKTNRLLLLGVLLIALLTMAIGFGISAKAEGEPEIYWTSVVDPDGKPLGTLEIGCTGAAPQRGLHFSTTDNELIIQTVGQLYLRGSADKIQRLSLDSVTAADITLMECGLANAVMSLNASTEYDIKLRLAEGTTNYLHSIAKGDSSGSLTIRGKGMLSLARIYGDPLTNVTFDGCVVTVDATTVGGSTAVPAIGCDEYYSPEEINDHVYNIVIKNGASVKATGKTYEDQMFGYIYGAAIGSIGTVINDEEAYSVNGSEATVYNGEGQPVVLMEIKNPTEADVRIDGVDVFDKHGDEQKIYAYVTPENHIVNLGDTVVNYTYGNGRFDNYIHGTQFVVSATNSGETLVYGEDYTYTEDNGVLTIMSDKAITIANADDVEVSNHRIHVNYGVEADITLNGVNIDVSSKNNKGAFVIADNSMGDVTVTLADGSVNVLKSGNNCAGLQKNGPGEGIGMLTICGTGSLSAQGGANGAGIGGGIDGSTANITITDKAVVTATGGAGGAGIGGGFDATLEDLIISGGSVNAVGSIFYDDDHGNSDVPAIGSGVMSDDYGVADGNSVTPTLADGTTPVYLLEIDNPNGEDIVIDGVDYPDSHGSETKIYAYVTAKNHTVKVGNTSKVYEYNNGSFIEFVHGKQFSVSATKSGETLVYGKDYTYSKSTKVLNILSDKAITIANADGVYEADDHILVAKNVNADITLAGVYINASSGAAFAIEGYGTGNVTVTLAKGSVNVLQSGEDFAGINKNDDDSTLTITGEGSLTAQGGAYAPGIGAGEATSNITIKGGNITATGGDGGAGIGGGYNGSSRNITITGTAVVTATGYGGAAGIGGGYSGTLEDIFITGGSVKAVGGIYVNEYYGNAKGAPIGGGVSTDFDVLMDGDPVTPTLADGTTRVYLLEIDNPNGEDIVIDGVDFPDKHGDENKIYAYVSLTVHTIKVGDTFTLYEYLNGAFTEMVHGTDLSVSATKSGETLEHGVDYTYSSATGILTVLTDKAITIANADGIEETDDRIIVEKNADANITLAGVNISASSGAAFAIAGNSTGDVTLTLADGSVNTLKGADFYAGLQKNGADENIGTLTIYGTGSLSAQGGTDSAGIGGANQSSTRNITISGGAVVTATGGVGSAGIGGGYGGSAEDITITDN